MQKFILVILFAILAATSRSQAYRVVENSRLAKVIARLKGEKEKYAITFGKTVFISCKKEEFLARPWWVKHELAHVQQYDKYGILGFLQLYLIYSLIHVYSENPLEKKAVAAEYAGN